MHFLWFIWFRDKLRPYEHCHCANANQPTQHSIDKSRLANLVVQSHEELRDQQRDLAIRQQRLRDLVCELQKG